MEEYKDFNAFEANAAAIIVEAYNLGFNDCKRKVSEAFLSLDLHQITLMGKLEEEEDKDDEGEKPARAIVEMTLVKKSSKSLCPRSLRWL